MRADHCYVLFGSLNQFLSSIKACCLCYYQTCCARSNIFARLFGNVKSWGFIWKLLLGQFLIGFGAGFTVPLFALYFKKVYNITADQWGTLASIAKFPYFFGMYLAPIVAKKIGNLKTVLYCQYLSIPFLLLTLFAPNLLHCSSRLCHQKRADEHDRPCLEQLLDGCVPAIGVIDSFLIYHGWLERAQLHRHAHRRTAA